MVFVSVTRLHLKSPRYLPAFWWNTALSTWQIINTPGFLGGKLLGDANGGAWTVSLWQDRSAMQHYRNSGAHRQVMPRLQKWSDEATFVHWEQEDSNLPTWEEAHRRMLTDGYFARLPEPSSAQLERKIPQPSSSMLRGLPLYPQKKARPKRSAK